MDLVQIVLYLFPTVQYAKLAIPALANIVHLDISMKILNVKVQYPKKKFTLKKILNQE